MNAGLHALRRIAWLVLLSGGLLPASPAMGQGAPPGGPAVDPLARRYAALQAQARDLKEQITRLENEITEIDRHVDELSQRAALLVPPEPQEAAKPREPKKYREVPFGTPIAGRDFLDTPLVLVCEENRVAVLDLGSASRQVEAFLKDQARLQQIRDNKGGTLIFAAGDYDRKITIVLSGPNPSVRDDYVRRAGRLGESATTLARPDSRVRKYIEDVEIVPQARASTDPSDRPRRNAPGSRGRSSNTPVGSVVQFAVYPDSYDVFRKARELVWQRKGLRLNWQPMNHGDKIQFGSAEGGVVFQGGG